MLQDRALDCQGHPDHLEALRSHLRHQDVYTAMLQPLEVPSGATNFLIQVLTSSGPAPDGLVVPVVDENFEARVASRPCFCHLLAPGHGDGPSQRDGRQRQPKPNSLGAARACRLEGMLLWSLRDFSCRAQVRQSAS